MVNMKIKIWDGVETAISHNDGFEPTLKHTYWRAIKRGAVLICPGGGYALYIGQGSGADCIAVQCQWIPCFCIKLQCGTKTSPQPIRDCARAMCLIRDNAEEWNIENSKTVICGFSAGAHLAASLGVHWNKPLLDVDGISIGKIVLTR